MMRTILVEGDKIFRIKVPDDARLTFGPWSPPKEKSFDYESKKGTLRVYRGGRTAQDILAVFSGVTSFRDVTEIDYEEQVTKEEGATIWNSDKNGYQREEKVNITREWETDPLLIEEPKKKRGK